MSKTATQTKHKMETSLRDLLATKLQALYDVENQLVKALPKMAKQASDTDLKSGFERHEKQTENHVTRLEQALEMLGTKTQKLQSEAVRGLVDDVEWLMKNVEGDAALDAGLTAAAQSVEHYEIAEYTSVIEWAKLIEESDIADLLKETLNEEEETSNELMELSPKIEERAAAYMPNEEES
jgi:ferritin-like metal-binding protein YciE